MVKILFNSLEVGGFLGVVFCMFGGIEGRVWYIYNVINEYIYNDCIINVIFYILYICKFINFF